MRFRPIKKSWLSPKTGHPLHNHVRGESLGVVLIQATAGWAVGPTCITPGSEEEQPVLHGTMGRPLVVACRGTAAPRRASWALPPSCGLSSMQSQCWPGGDTIVLVKNVAGMNIDENSSRIQRPATLQRHYTENSKQIFPEMKLRSLVHNSYNHVSVNHLYIPTIGLPILLSSYKFVRQTVGSPFPEKFYIWKLIKSIKTVLVICYFFGKFYVSRCHVCSFCPLSPYLNLVFGSTLSLFFSVTVSVLFTPSFTVSGTSLSLPSLYRSLSVLHHLSLVINCLWHFLSLPFLYLIPLRPALTVSGHSSSALLLCLCPL